MFASGVDAKGGSTVIIKEDKLSTVMSLVHVVLAKSLKPDFAKNKPVIIRPKNYHIDMISVILTLFAIYSFPCRYRRVFYKLPQL